jgi:hypothetical protein
MGFLSHTGRNDITAMSNSQNLLLNNNINDSLSKIIDINKFKQNEQQVYNQNMGKSYQEDRMIPSDEQMEDWRKVVKRKKIVWRLFNSRMNLTLRTVIMNGIKGVRLSLVLRTFGKGFLIPFWPCKDYYNLGYFYIRV